MFIHKVFNCSHYWQPFSCHAKKMKRKFSSVLDEINFQEGVQGKRTNNREFPFSILLFFFTLWGEIKEGGFER